MVPGARFWMGTEAWYSLTVPPAPLVTVKDHAVVVVPPDTRGIDVGTGTALADHVRVDDGHPPAPIGATCTEPGVLEVVAQLM